MAQEPQQGWVPTEDASVRQFWVLVNCDDITESNMPSEGVTTFGAFRLKTQAMIHSSWNAYIFVECGAAATQGFMRFYFAKSATSLEKTGRSHTSEEPLPPGQFLQAAVIETRNQIVPAGSAADTGADVLSSSVEPINGVRSRMQTSAVLSYDGTPLYSWALDEETGKGYLVTEEAVPAGTQGSTEVGSDGLFSDVRPVNAFWSIKTTKKTTTLDSTPVTYTKTERSPVYWPAVLLSHKFQMVLDASSLAYWHKKLFYSLKAAYTGDVQVAYSEWWQKSEPSPISAIEMIPTSIHIPREWSEDISIPECLHPLFEVTEGIIGGPFPYTGSSSLVGIQTARYSVPATNVTDWPDEVVKLDVDPYMGGFKCVKRVVQKPQVTVEGVNVQALAYEGGPYYQHNYDPDGAG